MGGIATSSRVAGRLVAFLTERREHEVLPTQCGRLSLAGWFRSRD